jgi:alcohol dehydrogenase
VANGKGELLAGGRRLRKNGEALNHHMGISCFAQYATVSRHSLVKIDPEVPLDEAAMFGCAVLTGVGAVLNTAAVRPGQTVAVVGLGGVGLTSLLGAIVAGARAVVAIDLNEQKLGLARQLGATHAFNAADADIVEKVKEATKGGVDVAVEMAGSVKALETAYKITRRGGQTVTAGLPNHTQTMALSPVNLVAEERTLKGSYIGSCVPLRDLPRYIALYRQGKLPVDRLLSDRLKLEDINAGFDRLAEGKAVRQVVVF